MGSSETIKWAAAPERKYPFLSPSAAATWWRAISSSIASRQQFGYEAAPDQVGFASPV